MARTCPECGSTVEWVCLTGRHVRTSASIYRCNGCDREFTDRELAEHEGLADV